MPIREAHTLRPFPVTFLTKRFSMKWSCVINQDTFPVMVVKAFGEIKPLYFTLSRLLWKSGNHTFWLLCYDEGALAKGLNVKAIGGITILLLNSVH